MKIIKNTKHGQLIILLNKEIYTKIISEGWTICIQNSNRKHPYAYLQKYVNKKKKRILLHRYILNPPPNFLVDHINRNTLDNRISNLRVVTPRENTCNMVTNTSGCAGVGYHKATQRWRAYYNNKNKHISLGYYNTKEEAVEARRKFERTLA